MIKKRFQLVIPEWLKDELKQAADDKGVSMSEFINDSLKSILEREKQSKTNAN